MNSEKSIFRQKKFILSFMSVISAMLVGALIFIIPPPLSTQLYETASGEYLTVDVAPDIVVELDANSGIAVKNSEPPSIELLRGSVYFNVKSPYIEHTNLEITAGDTVIKDMGASFSLSRQNNQFHAAVATRRIEIKTKAQTRFINADRQVAFNNYKILEETTINSAEIAPWRRIYSMAN